jgi:cytochrome c-type biogenesis protein CcmF
MNARWKRGNLRESRRELLGTGALALAIALAVVLGIYGLREVLAPVVVALGCWIALTALLDPVDRLRRRLTLSGAVLGMTLAHLGLGVMTIGIGISQAARVERDVALAPGQQVELGQYTFRFEGTERVDGPNYEAIRGRIAVTREGESQGVLLPERRNYYVQGQALAEAALGVRLRRDLLATLGEELGGGAWSVRLQVRPLMMLIWIGAALMALGGLSAAADRRYRVRSAAREAAASQAAAQRA